jgi:RNA polymerase sigma-70 factor, ECF subfamily
MREMVGAGDAREHDVRLARRMAAGDRSALGEAYATWSSRVHSVASRIVGHDAADVTHDAFMQAYERAGDYSGRGPLRAWIERIAVTLALKSLRRQRLFQGFASRTQLPVPATPVSAETAELETAIRELPDALRTVFVLQAVEGYTHDEVAAMLGITGSASRQRLRRARAMLIDRLELDPGL